MREAGDAHLFGLSGWHLESCVNCVYFMLQQCLCWLGGMAFALQRDDNKQCVTLSPKVHDIVWGLEEVVDVWSFVVRPLSALFVRVDLLTTF